MDGTTKEKVLLSQGKIEALIAKVESHSVVAGTGIKVTIDPTTKEYTISSTVKEVVITGKADKDLANVKVDVANAGKIARVKTDGSLE